MLPSLFCKTHVETIPSVDLPGYLQAQELFPKFYHRCQDSGEERAAFGSFVSLPFIPKLTKQMDPSLCFYGTLQFPSKKTDVLWKDFPPILFFLPLYEIRQSKAQTVLISRYIPHFPTPRLPVVLPQSPPLFPIEESPSEDIWKLLCKQTLEEIQAGTFHKAILSKKSLFSYEEAVPLFSFVKELADNHLSTSTFAWQTSPESLFLGSSPERLYQRKEDLLYTEALAGTRKRSSHPLEDLSLARELQESNKDKQEVLHVKEFLEKKLQPLSLSFSCPNNPKIISTKTLWHLRYPCEATLHPYVTDLDILTALHPTPAVGGTPSEMALPWINEKEPHVRGLYAGSLGWTSPLEAAFTVTIRSALLENHHLHAFSGAGIIEDSHPDLEWNELNDKLSHWNIACPT